MDQRAAVTPELGHAAIVADVASPGIGTAAPPKRRHQKRRDAVDAVSAPSAAVDPTPPASSGPSKLGAPGTESDGVGASPVAAAVKRSHARKPAVVAAPDPANEAASGQRANGTAKATRGLEIRYELLDSLEDYEYNANEHPPEQIALIEKLLAKFGWTTPMGKASGVLIYGHGRRRAARNLRDRGIAIPRNPDPDQGPVVDLSHLSKAERRAYRLADNESARKATTNADHLLFELGDLRLGDFDLSYTGYDDHQLATLFGADDETGGEEDDEPLIEGNVRCPECGHEFPTVAKAFRRIVAKRPRVAA